MDVTINGSEVIWNNQPAALTEIFGNQRRRTKVNLSNMNQVRLIVNVGVTGAAGSNISAQYSSDQTTWFYLNGSSGPTVNIDSIGLKISSYTNIASASKTDIFLRLVGANGNETADPILGLITLQFR